jgi:hypothetical protein
MHVAWHVWAQQQQQQQQQQEAVCSLDMRGAFSSCPTKQLISNCITVTACNVPMHHFQRAHLLCATPAGGYEPSVRDFAGLKALARRQGGDAATNRGACKICGGLGHLTKQCRNFIDNGAAGAAAGGAAGAAGAAAAGDGDNRQLLTADDDDALLLGSDSARSSDLGSDSDSGSSGDERVSAYGSSRGCSRAGAVVYLFYARSGQRVVVTLGLLRVWLCMGV